MRKIKNVIRDKNRKIKFLENRLEVKDEFIKKQTQIIDIQADKIDSISCRIKKFETRLQDAMDDYENEKKISNYYRVETNNLSKKNIDATKELETIKFNSKIATGIAIVSSSILMSIALHVTLKQLGVI